MTILIRHYVRRDLPEMLHIEARSFRLPWSERDFVIVQRERTCWTIVAEDGNAIVGYAVYVTYPENIEIVNLAVDPMARRMGVGTALVEHVAGKLSTCRRQSLVVVPSERNLVAHLFLRDRGFKATGVERLPFGPREESYREDGYRFEYRAKEAGFVPTNRIAKYVG